MNDKRDSDSSGRLSLPPVEEIAGRLAEEIPAEREPDDVELEHDPELVSMADAFVEQVLAESESSAEQQRRAVDEMGIEIQRQAAHHSAMLQTPLRKLAHEGDEGGPVAQALVNLRERMQSLDPQRHNLSRDALDRAMALIPGVGNRVQRYFRKFENAQEALDAIIADLESGRDMLHRDNLTLSDDQEALREILGQLRRQIDLGRLVDRRLSKAAAERDSDDSQRTFIEEELLFPLRQRIVDLQQQLAVSQQGVLALEVIIRNNRELMRGVDRAIHVTVSALTVAVTVAMALANQRLVLDKVESLNATTSDMISGTAKALRSQGVDIQTRASSAMLDMQALEDAFGDVMGAIDDLSRYRQEALPKLDEQIDRLEALSRQGGEAITRLERGNRTQDPTS
ncbi:KlaA protein [Litchfieldella qijiaojingensis]|uniref:KlaA protein n=1 Tax=Litchfieldella qijiaojingensis TaxID=980347 RepID=A0ABQ2YTC1_9GAMM|nr:toxic anion resistance protein [Halomonas qijiaojingensis]GGX94683.1 KlaA protein [Halomonas qijiaojingensis]